jgi:hypothetical protein
MPVNKDWFPSSRDEQLAMAKNWGLILPSKQAAWNIPEAAVTGLADATGAADTALSAAKNEATRTPVATARCREAFKSLEEKMRDIKRRYFLMPPLTEADFAALGLALPDPARTPSGVPTAEATVEIYLAGRHELGVKIVYVSGSPNDKANKGYRIWYKAVPPGGEQVTSPKQLNESYFTRRKKDMMRFEFEDSGKTAYIAVQIENDGKKGPWGPLVSAVIP